MQSYRLETLLPMCPTLEKNQRLSVSVCVVSALTVVRVDGHRVLGCAMQASQQTTGQPRLRSIVCVLMVKVCLIQRCQAAITSDEGHCFSVRRAVVLALPLTVVIIHMLQTAIPPSFQKRTLLQGKVHLVPVNPSRAARKCRDLTSSVCAL